MDRDNIPSSAEPLSSAEDGFTLIEVLVAITLTALIVSLMVVSLRLTTRGWERAESGSQHLDDVTTTEPLLRKLIGQAYPAIVLLGNGRYHVTFAGHPHSVEFTTTLPPIGAVGGFQRVAIYVEHGTLFLAHRIERDQRASVVGAEGTATIAILGGIQRIRLSYFGRKAPEDRPTWMHSWTDRKALPRLVRIELYSRRSQQPFPTLLIAPHIDVDSTCVFDALTRRCKGR